MIWPRARQLSHSSSFKRQGDLKGRHQRGRRDQILPHAEPIRAEVRYVCRNEMVCTLEDLLERRAGFLYWSAEQRLERARYGARVIRPELDLTEKEFEDQFARYREHLTRFHS